MHNAVEPLEDADSFVKEPRKDKIVTFLGRITMQKGPEYYVEAAARVLEKTKNVRFVMAGSGDMMEAMIDLAAQRGIADRFHFRASFADVMYTTCLHKAMCILCLPYRSRLVFHRWKLCK